MNRIRLEGIIPDLSERYKYWRRQGMTASAAYRNAKPFIPYPEFERFDFYPSLEEQSFTYQGEAFTLEVCYAESWVYEQAASDGGTFFTAEPHRVWEECCHDPDYVYAEPTLHTFYCYKADDWDFVERYYYYNGSFPRYVSEHLRNGYYKDRVSRGFTSLAKHDAWLAARDSIKKEARELWDMKYRGHGAEEYYQFYVTHVATGRTMNWRAISEYEGDDVWHTEVIDCADYLLDELGQRYVAEVKASGLFQSL